jgi:hypothetical protein
MTNKLRTLMAFSALGVSLAGVPAFAGESLRVSVPFAFTAGKTSLPAGDYTVYEDEDNHLLTIRGDKGSILLLGTPGTTAATTALGFQRTGKGYALTSVHSAGRTASVITPSRSER